MTTLGPNGSASLAERMQTTPKARSLTEEAPEVRALVHPKVSMNDSKKIPKVKKVPHIVAIMINTAVTTTYP
jgi:hypothetical protein